MFNPKIHGVRHHVPQNTPGQRKKFREHEELKEVFEFLRNEDKSSTSYDDELVERELIPLEEYFEELKKMHASQACVVL
jgi:hypothetical protein